MVKILCDSQLANPVEAFSPIGQVILKNWREITPDDLAGIDALVVRTVTKVKAELLTEADELKFVGSATAGYDHIDLDLLHERGISFKNAAGCNKESVGDYVLSILLMSPFDELEQFRDKSIGIIGCGQTGMQVEMRAMALGMQIFKCDPPRQRDGDKTCSATLEEALGCDYVTFHVPLTVSGPDKTDHLLNADNVGTLKPGCTLINCSRGRVTDNAVLLEALKKRRDLRVFLDVFEGEPQIREEELLGLLSGATAHIAGASIDAKRRAVAMLAPDMGEALGKPGLQVPYYRGTDVSGIRLADSYAVDLNLIRKLSRCIYDVRDDIVRFRDSYTGFASFDALRLNYRMRHEMQSAVLENVREEDQETFDYLGFSTRLRS